MLFALTLLAQEAGKTTPDAAPSANPLGMMLPILAIMVVFYFLMVRPMKRQETERKRLLSELKKNQKVVTSGGIIGIIAAISDKDDEVTLKVDESSNVRLRVLKSSIARVVTGDESKEQKDSGAPAAAK